MRHRLATSLGILMIAVGLLGASLTFGSTGWSVEAHEGTPVPGEPSTAHERMHQMMDMMMGEGFSERMHAAMPGSEAMMEACASGMMDGMDETMRHHWERR